MAKADRWLKEKNLQKITQWAENEKNNISDIAGLMGVSPSTFYKWKREYPQIEEAFEQGRKRVDEKVENSFFDMCTGFYKKVKKMHKLRRKEFDENGKVIAEYDELVEGEDEVYIPPNVTAQKFYLCNRMPQRYRPENAALPPGDEDDNNTGVIEMPITEEPEEGKIIDAEIIES